MNAKVWLGVIVTSALALAVSSRRSPDLEPVAAPAKHRDAARGPRRGDHHGSSRVAELSFSVRHEFGERPMAESLRLRWGRPRIRGSIWTWHRADRIIEANLDPDVASVRITMREA